jgi:hypothetical protein
MNLSAHEHHGISDWFTVPAPSSHDAVPSVVSCPQWGQRQ